MLPLREDNERHSAELRDCRAGLDGVSGSIYSGGGGGWKTAPSLGMAGVGAVGDATSASMSSMSSTLSFAGSARMAFGEEVFGGGAVGVF